MGIFFKHIQVLPFRVCCQFWPDRMALVKCASSKWRGNLFGDISHLREKGHCADVRLVAGVGNTASLAHSLVLAAVSPCLQEALLSLPPSETDLLILVPDASQDEVSYPDKIHAA